MKLFTCCCLINILFGFFVCFENERRFNCYAYVLKLFIYSDAYFFLPYGQYASKYKLKTGTYLCTSILICLFKTVIHDSIGSLWQLKSRYVCNKDQKKLGAGTSVSTVGKLVFSNIVYYLSKQTQLSCTM